MRKVADHSRIRPARQGGGDVGYIERRSRPRCEVEGHDDRAPQVPHAPPRRWDEAGLASNKRFGSHTSAGRITHRDQVIKKRVQPLFEVPEAARGEELVRGAEGLRRERGEGLQRERRRRPLRRGRVKERVVTNEVAKVARPNPIRPRVQVVMVRVCGGHQESGAKARIGTPTPQERVGHGVIRGKGQRKSWRQEWPERTRPHCPVLRSPSLPRRCPSATAPARACR
eukprot:2796250-Pleurochrysis_carterae.AAC.1